MAIRLLTGMGDDPLLLERGATTALEWSEQRTSCR